MKYLSGPDSCHALAARRSARYMTRLYDRYLAPSGLTISQFSVLALIEEHSAISVSVLSERMMMERTTLLRALKPLRDSGLILCEAQGAKSALAYSLSAAGKVKVGEAEPYWLAAQKAFEAHAGKERAVALRGTILDIVFAA